MTSIAAGGASVSQKVDVHGSRAERAPTPTDVERLAHEVTPWVRDLRHDLHRHPELCYQEHRTSEVVARELRALGAQVRTGLAKLKEGSPRPLGVAESAKGGTGVLGYFPATDPADEERFLRAGGAVALRADMDALPILERTGKAYASTIEGVMHACGHDGHTSMLLGAAKVLSKVHRPRPVLLVFQPAEEGGGGARVLCEEGALGGGASGAANGAAGLGARVTSIYGLHGWPTLEVGTVATKPGPLLAATDDFDVTIRGTQSHGAYPHFGCDPIVASAQAITALQTIASRNVSPLDAIVVTVGIIQAGTADNIIPETCRFVGTVRTLQPRTRELAKARFHEIVDGCARAMGCKAEVTWVPGYPVTSNDAGTARAFLDLAKERLGDANAMLIEQPTMGGEDFAYYGQHARACFFLLGLRPKGAATSPTLHQPDFDFNDEAIPTGVRMLVEAALR